MAEVWSKHFDVMEEYDVQYWMLCWMHDVIVLKYQVVVVVDMLVYR